MGLADLAAPVYFSFGLSACYLALARQQWLANKQQTHAKLTAGTLLLWNQWIVHIFLAQQLVQTKNCLLSIIWLSLSCCVLSGVAVLALDNVFLLVFHISTRVTLCHVQLRAYFPQESTQSDHIPIRHSPLQADVAPSPVSVPVVSNQHNTSVVTHVAI